jgi:ribosomal protein S18 acetylase RimI-like enzyme
LLQQLGYWQSSEQLRGKLSGVPAGCCAFVAETGRKIAGFMSLHIINWLHRPDPAARLSAVVVDTAYRRLGIGRALIAFAEAAALERGCTYIELTSNLRRKADGTYDFYASLGYEPARETTYFRKPLRKHAS